MHTRVKRHSEALAQGREYLAGEGREKKGVGQTDELKSSGLRRRFGTIYRTEARVVFFQHRTDSRLLEPMTFRPSTLQTFLVLVTT